MSQQQQRRHQREPRQQQERWQKLQHYTYSSFTSPPQPPNPKAFRIDLLATQEERNPLSSSSNSPSNSDNNDNNNNNNPQWNPNQYLKYADERQQPIHDLIARIRPLIRGSPAGDDLRIFDLGSGPGTSTMQLAQAFPGSQDIVGVDSSVEMFEAARAAARKFAGRVRVRYQKGDVGFWGVPEVVEDAGKARQRPQTLLFSNATLHWLRNPLRLATVTRLFSQLAPADVFACQLPDNYHSHTHRLMREVALLPDRPWSAAFSDARIADVACKTRPDLDPIESAGEWYAALMPYAEAGRTHVWRTEYLHVLPGVRDVVEWVRGSGLRPFLERITGEEVQREFLKEYERALGERGVFERVVVSGVERVVLPYRRLFVVGVRGAEGQGQGEGNGKRNETDGVEGKEDEKEVGRS